MRTSKAVSTYVVHHSTVARTDFFMLPDIIECMATSDNVVNASFAPPESRDVHTFSSMLTYSAYPWTHWSLPRTSYKHSKNGLTQAYAPPLPEFTVLGTQLESGKETEVLGKVDGPTCGIVRDGAVILRVEGEDAMELERGTVVFVAPGKDIEVTSKVKDGKAAVWWATCFA